MRSDRSEGRLASADSEHNMYRAGAIGSQQAQRPDEVIHRSNLQRKRSS
jgi:hypothetical protein